MALLLSTTMSPLRLYYHDFVGLLFPSVSFFSSACLGHVMFYISIFLYCLDGFFRFVLLNNSQDVIEFDIVQLCYVHYVLSFWRATSPSVLHAHEDSEFLLCRQLSNDSHTTIILQRAHYYLFVSTRNKTLSLQ